MRGLFLAVFALLIVAGDSGRYAPQLISNAISVLSPSHQNVGGTSLESEETGESDSAQPDAIAPDSTDTTLENNPRDNALALLWLAAKQGSDTAQVHMLEIFESAYNNGFSSTVSVDQETATYFLEKLVNLENADAAWLLYQILGEEGASERFMRLAALGDVAEAQLAFAMSTDSPEKREKWLIR
ncbi:MAG: sel1 repeat family protein, partial [Pseudomonadota bacterium]|nr:sel1 repeat family protein [Pseudomonadota bacterium]